MVNAAEAFVAETALTSSCIHAGKILWRARLLEIRSPKN